MSVAAMAPDAAFYGDEGTAGAPSRLAKILLQRAAWERSGRQTCPHCGRNVSRNHIRIIDRGMDGIGCTACDNGEGTHVRKTKRSRSR